MRTEDHFDVADALGDTVAWASVWHLWTVLLPRRTITGKLVCGRVWRRHDGRRWIYKQIEFAEFDH